MDPLTMAALGKGASVVSSVLGGIFGHNSAKKQRARWDAGRDMANTGLESGYNEVNAMYSPYRESGEGALGRMDRTMGGDMSDFNVSPGYNFRKSEGMRDIGNVYAGKGGGGNAMRALNEFNSGLASQEFGNWWDRNSGMADRGLAATSGTASARSSTSARQSNNTMMAAGGGARTYQDEFEGYGNAMNAGIGNYLYGQKRGWWGGDPNNPPGHEVVV